MYHLPFSTILQEPQNDIVIKMIFLCSKFKAINFGSGCGSHWPVHYRSGSEFSGHFISLSSSGSYSYLGTDPFRIQQYCSKFFVKFSQIFFHKVKMYQYKLIIGKNKTYEVENDVFFTAFWVHEAWSLMIV